MWIAFGTDNFQTAASAGIGGDSTQEPTLIRQPTAPVVSVWRSDEPFWASFNPFWIAALATL
jgi:hypothetical protein